MTPLISGIASFFQAIFNLISAIYVLQLAEMTKLSSLSEIVCYVCGGRAELLFILCSQMVFFSYLPYNLFVQGNLYFYQIVSFYYDLELYEYGLIWIVISAGLCALCLIRTI